MLRNVNINVIKKAISKNKKTLSKYEDTTKNTEILKMGFLLMQYEYQRASHEVTVHTAAQIRYANMQTRYADRVKNMESIFSKRKNQLSTDYKDLQSSISANLSAATSGSLPAFNSLLTTICIGGHYLDEYIDTSGISTTATGAELLRELSSLAQKANSVVQTLINNAKDADEARLKDQEDSMIDPIREKDEEMDAKQGFEKIMTDTWDARKTAAKDRLAKEVKDSFGGFTLGG